MEVIKDFQQLTETLTQKLKELGFAKATLDRRKSYFNSISNFMHCHNIDDYCPLVGADYLAYKKPLLAYKSYQCEVANIHQLDETFAGNNPSLYHLVNRTKRIAPQEFGDVCESYRRKLEASGLRPSTVETKIGEITAFLINLKELGVKRIENITPEIIVKVAAMSDSQNYCSNIRHFLQFLNEIKVLNRDFAMYLPKQKSIELLPTVYTKEELESIDKTFDIDTALGKRNHAMFLLAARLGLRTSDSSNLKITDIDFEQKTVSIVQMKTVNPLRSVLIPELDYALRDYIHNGRPASDSEYVFLKHMAPYSKLSNDTMYSTINYAISKAGIDIHGRKHGPHALRSSLATAMVNNGMTYEQVRDVLGHTEANTIKHYASLDIERLRMCALEISEPSGYFASFLEGKEVIHHE